MSNRAKNPARRMLAMFCMALCLALSAQMTIAVRDRVQHVLDVAHAPSALAGHVDVHDHHDHHDHAAPHAHGQEQQDDDADDNFVSHQHRCGGILVPWLASPSVVIVGSCVQDAAYRHAALAPPDIAERRRDRPPKPVLESV